MQIGTGVYQCFFVASRTGEEEELGIGEEDGEMGG